MARPQLAASSVEKENQENSRLHLGVNRVNGFASPGMLDDLREFLSLETLGCLFFGAFVACFLSATRLLRKKEIPRKSAG